MKYKLLIVDDEQPNLRLLERLFARDFDCLTASSGAEAIRLLEQHDVALLITDQRMPEMTGIDLLIHTARLRPHMVRILLTGYTDVEVLVDAVNSGLVYMYVSKPWKNEDLKLKVNRAREHYESNKNGSRLALANHRLAARLEKIKSTVAASLAEMLKGRDQYAYDHALRVQNYATSIGENMELSESEIEDLSAAAALHSLGDADVSNNGSTCVRELITEQTTFARSHAECEAKLLSAIPELAPVADLIKFHRENFDGSGSPGGLAGDQIPLGSRILRVADEYDLLVQPKRSSSSLRHEETMRFLSQRAGKQFDPRVIEMLNELPLENLHPVNATPANRTEAITPHHFEPAGVDALL